MKSLNRRKDDVKLNTLKRKAQGQETKYKNKSIPQTIPTKVKKELKEVKKVETKNNIQVKRQ